MSGSTLVIMRRIEAPVETVWQMLVDPEELRHWLGPRDFTVTELAADVRVGGLFRFRMRKNPGGMYGAEGAYREIVANERVVMTWCWNEAPAGEPLDTRETLLTIAVQRDGRHTMVTLTHALLADDEAVKNHGSGWREALDKLLENLATHTEKGNGP